MPNLVNVRSFIRTRCKFKNVGRQIYNVYQVWSPGIHFLVTNLQHRDRMHFMSLERILMKLYTFNDKSSGAAYCLNEEKSETRVIAL